MALAHKLFEKYMSYINISNFLHEEYSRETYTRHFNRLDGEAINSNSYYATSESYVKFGKYMWDLFAPVLEKENLDSYCEEHSNEIRRLMGEILHIISKRQFLNLPMALRKIIFKTVDLDQIMFLLKNEQELDDLAVDLAQSMNGKTYPKEEAKVVVAKKMFKNSRIVDAFPQSNYSSMSMQDILDILITSLGLNKATLASNKDIEAHYYPLGEALYSRIIGYQDTALSEYESLSDEDKQLIQSMVLAHKKYVKSMSIGYTHKEDMAYIKKYKSFDLFESYVFCLDSSHPLWKDKGILSNAFAVWYACKKSTIPKYVQNKLGKFKPLLTLYKYNWDAIKSIIVKDKEIIEALN
jgi:hypothetical protein